MAISEMEKVGVIAHQSLRKEILDRLQDLGVLEISEDEKELFDEFVSPSGELGELERRLGELSYCLDFIDKYRSEKPGIVQSLFPAPIHMSKEDFLNCSFDYTPLYKNFLGWEEELNDIRGNVNRLNSNLEFMKRIQSVNVSLENLRGTLYTRSFLIEVPLEKKEVLEEKLKERNLAWLGEEFPGKGKSIWWWVVIHRSGEEAMGEILAELSLSPLSLPQPFEGTPQEVIEDLEHRIGELQKQQSKLLEKAALQEKFEREFKIAYDYYLSLWERYESETRLLKTKETCYVSGWIEKENLPRVEESLSQVGKEWVLYHREPEEGEDVPVILENNSWVNNFAVLTHLYGLPNYTEIDPTPFVAGFFFFFFGMCLGDVIYGLVLALFGFIAAAYLDISDSTKTFMRMLAWGGVGAILVGICTGSWLGDLFDYLPSSLSFLATLKNSLMVIDPLNNPLPMLIFSLGVGIVQILVGVMLATVKEWKRGNYAVAIMDHLSWFVFLTSIVLYIVGIAALPLVASVALPVVIGSAIFLVATQGRHQKNPIMKFLSGLMSLYGLVSYLGDTLSYSRLFALGLSSTIIAILARTLGSLFGGYPYIGWLIALLVALAFHVFNLLMSGLGAFVHSARLQYVEFFNKFYEDGGRNFKPFGYKTKYVKIS
ncbi:MAG: V-type ATP synthase subunit I [Candidatus Atribacteria bacterium]|nr:V-type ATP synthase subunit I [Candidatus Atribacteria bacterium]